MRAKSHIIVLIAVLLGLTGCGEKTPQARLEATRRLVDNSRFEKAVAELPALMQVLPTDSAVLLLGARIYTGLKLPDSVLAYTKKLTALFPQHAEGYRLMYDAGGALKNYDAQIWAISQLGYVEGNRRKYFLEIARLNFERGQYGLSIATCNDILTYDPGNPQVLFLMAGGLAAAGQMDSAIVVMEELRRKNPDQVEILSNLGSFYANKRDFGKARDCFLELTTKVPDYLPGWFGLGHCRLGLGDTLGARDAYRQVYSRDTSFLGVDSILRELNQLPINQ